LVVRAPSGAATRASAIYAASLHRSPRARFWLARLDLAVIFALVAGTYTPMAMLRLGPELGRTVLVGVRGPVSWVRWFKTVWIAPPKWRAPRSTWASTPRRWPSCGRSSSRSAEPLPG